MYGKKGIKTHIKLIAALLVVMFIAGICVMVGKVSSGTNTGNFWGDLLGGDGTPSSFERFWNEKVLGYDVDAMEGGGDVKSDPFA